MTKRIPTQDYLECKKPISIYNIKVKPNFTPVDINLQFIIEEGWSNADRFRFHAKMPKIKTKNEAMNTILRNIQSHLLIRRYDKAQDSFISIHVSMDGTFEIFSNDEEFAHKYLEGLFLEFPPSFHSIEDLQFTAEWVNKAETYYSFLGLLQGALGWDSFDQIPAAIKASLEEAERALSIANYRSCVVMCRRTIEALLKFAFQRLINKPPTDNHGRTLTLDAIIKYFRQQQSSPIPAHLLHILDAIRVIGNIPGAHPVEIKGYKFSKLDAEFTIASVRYFIEQYFSQIDKEVTKYYTLTIN